MPDRPVHYRDEFRADLAARMKWLAANRPVQQIDNLESALDGFRRLVATNPGMGREIALRDGRSYRVFGLGRLPYLVWYFYDVGRPAGPVWLALLMHEKQDRERFDPDAFE